MKKILLIILFLTLFSSISINAYTDTGHEEFISITPKDQKVKILEEMSTARKNELSKDVKKTKFFGWRTKYSEINEPIDYVGKILFTRSNASSNDIVFSYNLKESITNTTSFNLTNTLNVKGSGGKKIDISLAEELELDYEEVISTNVVESMAYDIVVPSGRKVTMYTYGEGRISNGCSAKYFFFFRVEFGFWEIVEIKTLYYKIEEEEI